MKFFSGALIHGGEDRQAAEEDLGSPGREIN